MFPPHMPHTGPAATPTQAAAAAVGSEGGGLGEFECTGVPGRCLMTATDRCV